MFKGILIRRSEDDILLSPLLPTRRSSQAYTGYQPLPEESVYNSVRQQDQVRAARCLT